MLLAGRRDGDADHLSAALRREGFDVLLAADVATVEGMLHERRADAVIIHHDMGGAGNGFVMSRRLRRDADLVMVMIDAPTTEDRVAAFDVGLDDCLPPGTKPIEVVARCARFSAVAESLPMCRTSATSTSTTQPSCGAGW